MNVQKCVPIQQIPPAPTTPIMTPLQRLSDIVHDPKGRWYGHHDDEYKRNNSTATASGARVDGESGVLNSNGGSNHGL